MLPKVLSADSVFALSTLILAGWAAAVAPANAAQGPPDVNSRGASGQTEGQETTTRAGELRARREARLAEVEPADRNTVAEILATVENDGFDQIVTAQRGHFRFGFGKISPASGGTPAIQYERPRLGASPLTLRTAAAYSLRGYQAYDLQLGVFKTPAPYRFMGDGFLGAPFDFGNRSVAPLDDFLYFDAHYRRFPKEEFFGIGPASSLAERSDYRIDDRAVDVVAGYQLTRWMGIQARGSYLQVETGPGSQDSLPDTVDLFTPTTAPGLNERTNFWHFSSGLTFAWEGDPNQPAAELGLRFARLDDTDGELYAFNRVSVDARGFLPLGSRQRTLAARIFASSDYADAGAQVPFYLMETLGGHDTLRGFLDFRFRDTNVLYLSGEYRWEATAGVDLAIFYDTGKVFSDRSDFGFEDLRNTVGFGIRGKSMRRVVFRLDIGQSNEGTHLYIAFGPSF